MATVTANFTFSYISGPLDNVNFGRGYMGPGGSYSWTGTVEVGEPVSVTVGITGPYHTDGTNRPLVLRACCDHSTVGCTSVYAAAVGGQFTFDLGVGTAGGKARYRWNGEACVPDPNGKYDSLAACYADHVEAPPRYDFIGGVCQESVGGQYDSLGACQAAHPSGGGGTGDGPTPPGGYTGGINADNIVTYIAQWIKWLGDEAAYLEGLFVAAIWKSLPQPIQNWFTKWDAFFTGIKEFFGTPGAFYRKHESALWESGSGTPIGMHVDNSSAYVKQRISDVKASQGSDIDIGGMIKDGLKSGFDSLGATFEAPVTVEGALDAATNAALGGLAVETTAAILALATEWIPTENLSGLAFIIQGIVNSFGTGRFVSGRLFGTYEANVGKQLEYALNEKYQHTLEALNELVSQRRKGLITNDDFTQKAIRVSGLTGDMVHTHYKNSLAVPGFEDVITYHHRHPNEVIDFGTLQDWMGINYLDYKKYFDERQWVDIPIRTLKMIYQAGAIPVGDVDNRIRRQGIRTDILPGDTLSDFQVYHNYVTEGQEATLEKQLLQSTLKLFLEGKTDLAGLQAAAAKVYSDPTQLTTYMQTAQNKLEAEKTKAVKEKSFGYALLIKLAESGIDVTPFMDSDLTAENWDQAHRTAIEAYITAALAKKNLGLNGQPLAPTGS